MDNRNKNICLVNEKDEIVGSLKALVAHHKEYFSLHRAFSVFIFNSDGKLLLQKRSKEKLVFPSLWTNTCCSHPFINHLSFTDPILDCKLHAIARLEYEMGIKNLKPCDLKFIGRIKYHAMGDDTHGEMINGPVNSQDVKEYPEPENPKDFEFKSEDFCEYEVDYVFIGRTDMLPTLRSSEAESFEFVSKEDLPKFISDNQCTPWMKHILNYMDIFKEAESVEIVK